MDLTDAAKQEITKNPRYKPSVNGALLYRCNADGIPVFEITHLFWADMQPVGGPVLGPYKQHDTAIAAEVEWLHQHNLPDRK